MNKPILGIQEIIKMANRRKVPMIIGALGILLLGAAIVFTISPAYRSTATILIEEQEIPSDLVRSAITTYADQRIETIKQQVMSRATLWKIVEQYNLYKRMRKQSPTEEVLNALRKIPISM